MIAEEEAKEEAARKAIEEEKAKKRQKAKDKVIRSAVMVRKYYLHLDTRCIHKYNSTAIFIFACVRSLFSK